MILPIMTLAHDFPLLSYVLRFEDNVHIVIFRIQLLLLNVDGDPLVVNRNPLILDLYDQIPSMVWQTPNDTGSLKCMNPYAVADLETLNLSLG